MKTKLYADCALCKSTLHLGGFLYIERANMLFSIFHLYQMLLPHLETVVYGLVWNSHRAAFAKGSVSHQLGPFSISPWVTKWELALDKRRILCPSGKDPFSYCSWLQQVVSNDTPPSYLTCCIGKGLINK